MGTEWSQTTGCSGYLPVLQRTEADGPVPPRPPQRLQFPLALPERRPRRKAGFFVIRPCRYTVCRKGAECPEDETALHAAEGEFSVRAVLAAVVGAFAIRIS